MRAIFDRCLILSGAWPPPTGWIRYPDRGMNPLTGLGVWTQWCVLSRRKKTPLDHQRGFSYKCLTMTYFHGRMPTIIGAKAFHCPVRNGKGVVPPCYCHQA